MSTTKENIVSAAAVWFRLLNRLRDFFLLFIRLYWGYAFLLAGWGKLTNFDRTVGFFQSLNIPMPEVNVALAASTEFLGGICLLVGLGSRFITVPLIFTMGVAYATAHRVELVNVLQDPEPFLSAPPFLFLYTCLVVLFFGAGRISLDYLLTRNR